MDRLYAHSGQSKFQVPPQYYEDHILGMLDVVAKWGEILPAYYQKAVGLAVLFHDMGKLFPESQQVLSQPDRTGEKLKNHVDAGVAYCLREFDRSGSPVWVMAARLIHAHHIGLEDKDRLCTERVDGWDLVVEIQSRFRDEQIRHETDEQLDRLYALHRSVLSDQEDRIRLMPEGTADESPMLIRFALSVLVHADHSDTALHYNRVVYPDFALKATERLALLNQLFEQKRSEARQKGFSEELIESRSELFRICSAVDLSKNQFFVCTAPTGKGKTLSLMNLALRLASEKNRDRIHFVIPFTNIISQSVQEYRSLVLPDEPARSIVNEIHSKVEHSNYLTRAYSQMWESPINVSTSVQFFNSLFSNHPSAVRKLHSWANSVVVFDEYHTSIPHHLWKVALLALKEIAPIFNIDFVFGSGTHVYYWDVFNSDIDVKNVIPTEVFERFQQFENERVTFSDMGVFQNDEAFYEAFEREVTREGHLLGNTLLILNTVKNAITVTDQMERRHPSWLVFHLSSYLTPHDREVILEQVKSLLKTDQRILVVATSVVECGVDFSFDYGFREKGSMMSTIQFGGRINRNRETECAKVLEFSFDPEFLRQSERFSHHPGLTPAILAREGFEVKPSSCTSVIGREMQNQKSPYLDDLEQNQKFNLMNQRFQVIPNLTESVLIDSDLITAVQLNEKVSPVELSRKSVSIYRSKFQGEDSEWAEFVEKYEDMYFWRGPYDPTKYGIGAVYFS